MCSVQWHSFTFQFPLGCGCLWAVCCWCFIIFWIAKNCDIHLHEVVWTNLCVFWLFSWLAAASNTADVQAKSSLPPWLHEQLGTMMANKQKREEEEANAQEASRPGWRVDEEEDEEAAEEEDEEAGTVSSSSKVKLVTHLFWYYPSWCLYLVCCGVNSGVRIAAPRFAPALVEEVWTSSPVLHFTDSEAVGPGAKVLREHLQNSYSSCFSTYTYALKVRCLALPAFVVLWQEVSTVALRRFSTPFFTPSCLVY